MTQTSNNGLIGSAVGVVLLFLGRQGLDKWLDQMSEGLTDRFSDKAECIPFGRLVSVLLLLRSVTALGDMGSIRAGG